MGGAIALWIVMSLNVFGEEPIIASIEAKPKCNSKSVSDSLKSTPLNDEIVLAALKSGCDAVFSDAEKFRSWYASDHGGHAVDVAGRYHKHLANELSNSRLIDLDVSSVGFGTEFVKETKRKYCGGERSPKACGDLDGIERTEKKIAKAAEEKPDLTVPEQACTMLAEKKYYEGVISKEKEAGKLSGVVDKQKLYEAGKVISHHTEELAPFEREYKKRTGKILSLEKCPKKFQE